MADHSEQPLVRKKLIDLLKARLEALEKRTESQDKINYLLLQTLQAQAGSPRTSEVIEQYQQQPEVDSTEDVLDYVANCKFHYDQPNCVTIASFLKVVEKSLANEAYLHDWDELWYPDPVKNLAEFARGEIERHWLQGANYLAGLTAIDRVLTTNGLNKRKPIDDIYGNLADLLIALSERDWAATLPTREADSSNKDIHASFGRVIFIKESAKNLERVTLLLLHAYCLRLLNEDSTFIRNFVTRHTSLKCSMKWPGQLQETMPSVEQTCVYRRVTVSFHLPHLLVQDIEDRASEHIKLDSVFLGNFGSASLEKSSAKTEFRRSCSSVLLTLVIPQHSSLKEEAIELFSKPQALWTVLVVNTMSRHATGIRREPVKYLTPIAQFIRGVHAAVASQRSHLTVILDRLKDDLGTDHSNAGVGSTAGPGDLGDDLLFDDSDYSKSRRYYWLIQTCHELCASIEANVKFVRQFQNEQLPNLVGRAHSYEKAGIEHWKRKLAAECAALDIVFTEINAFREQVRELREALHGMTAILETRQALQQGDRVRMLAYLSGAYLPIATISSIYSTNVLPSSATLNSFLIASAVTTVVTAGLAFNIRRLQTGSKLLKFALIRTTSVLTPLRDLLQPLVRRWRRPYERKWEAFVSDEKGAGISWTWGLTQAMEEAIFESLVLFWPPPYTRYTIKFLGFKSLFGDLCVALLLPVWGLLWVVLFVVNVSWIFFKYPAPLLSRCREMLEVLFERLGWNH